MYTDRSSTGTACLYKMCMCLCQTSAIYIDLCGVVITQVVDPQVLRTAVHWTGDILTALSCTCLSTLVHCPTMFPRSWLATAMLVACGHSGYDLAVISPGYVSVKFLKWTFFLSPWGRNESHVWKTMYKEYKIHALAGAALPGNCFATCWWCHSVLTD